MLTATEWIDSIDWLPPWQAAGPGLEAELTREVGALHPLYRRKATSVARRIDNDDVLFFLADAEPAWAVVHLTWTGSAEISEKWPQTTFYVSIEEWIERCMKSDHAEYSGNRES